jgi:hypothetical protein
MLGLIAAASVAVRAQGGIASVVVTPSTTAFTGRCPVSVVFTGTIKYATPFPPRFNYSYFWYRSDKSSTKRVSVTPNANVKSLTIHETLLFKVSGAYADTLYAQVSATQTTASAKVNVTCK